MIKTQAICLSLIMSILLTIFGTLSAASPVITQGASVSVVMNEDGTWVDPNLTASDGDGDTLTWSIDAQASHGYAVVSGNFLAPKVGYFPANNYNGSDNFILQVSDGGSSANVLVNVTLNPVADAPVIYSGNMEFEKITINITDGSSAGLAVADLDGDGDLDVISGFYHWLISAGNVIWSENLGNNTFAPEVSIGAVIRLEDLKVADMDNDGDMDILVCSGSSGTIDILENDGAQNFTKVVAGSSLGSIQHLSVADINKDGKLDIVCSGYSNSDPRWLRNNGSLNFTTIVIDDLITSSRVHTVIDLDRDGNLDVIAMEASPAGLFWYLGDGSGNFTKSTMLAITEGARSIAAGDVDGDGDIDFVINEYQYSSGRLVWYENDGTLNFTRKLLVSVGEYLLSIKITDLNLDGFADILISDSRWTTPKWLRNDGSQNFTLQSLGTLVDSTKSLAIDFDNDGDLDVFSTGNQTLSYFENKSFDINMSEDGSPVAYAGDIKAIDYDGDALTWSLSSSATNGTATASGSGNAATTTYFPVADYNGADAFTLVVNDGALTDSAVVKINVLPGDNDPVSITQGNTLAVTIDEDGAIPANTITATDPDSDAVFTWSVLSTSTNGYLKVSGNTRAPNINYYPRKNYNGSDSFSLQVNDGAYSANVQVDITITPVNDAPVVYSGNMEFEKITINTILGSSGGLDVADLDGDGDLDVISGYMGDFFIIWSENLGNNTFAPEVPISTTSVCYAVKVADMDNDGDMDIIGSSFTNGAIYVFENDGAQNFTEVLASSTVGGILNLDVVDINKDGKLDIVCSGPANGDPSWLRNDGSLNFTTIVIDDLNDSYRHTVIDLDRDGNLDVVAIERSPTGLFWYLGDGAGNFTKSAMLSVPTMLSAIAAGDVDGDGDIDFVTNESQYLVWYENDGALNFTRKVLTSYSGDSINSLKIVDLNLDGFADVLISDMSSSTMNWLKNDGNQNFTLQSLGALIQSFYSLAIDFDNDGDLDVFSSDGSLTLSYFENKSFDITMSEDGTPTAFVVPTDIVAFDPEGDTITWSTKNNPSHGFLSTSGSGNIPTLTYTPVANYFGSDSFRIKASDGNSSSNIQISANILSVVDVPVITQGNSISVTMDEDGTFTAPTITGLQGDGLPIFWTLLTQSTNGTATASGNTSTPDLTYTPPLNFNGTDSFTIEVSDNTLTANIIVNVTINDINDAPIAFAGSDFSINEGERHTLTGSGNDIDGTISYAWTQLGGAGIFSDSTSKTSTFTAPAVANTGGDLVLQLTVTDDDGATASSNLTVFINNVNQLPVITQSGNSSFYEHETANFSFNINDSDGSVVSYAWAQTSGPTVTLSSTTIINPTFTVPTLSASQSTAVFQLSATDNDGGIGSGTLSVTLNKIVPPTANAGNDKTVDELSTATLSASASSDSDGTIVGYAWSQTAGTSVILSSDNTVSTSFTTLEVPFVGETLTFSVLATDNHGGENTDTINIIVSNVNKAPTANAGTDQTVDESVFVTLSANASSDIDGTIAGYAWTQLSGDMVTLTGNTTKTLTFTTLAQSVIGGFMTFELTVTDNEGLTATDEVRVAVDNAPPDASAGVDQTVNELAVVTLDASASNDIDGTIAKYTWLQTAGTTVALSDSSVAKPTFTAFAVPSAGEQITFQVTVKDDGGLTMADTVTITISDFNYAPIVGAGSDLEAKYGEALTFSGASVSDKDGTPAIAWTQTGGESVEITDAETLTPTITLPKFGAESAIFTFKLTATDELGKTDEDTFSIAVKADRGDFITEAIGKVESMLNISPTKITVVKPLAINTKGEEGVQEVELEYLNFGSNVLVIQTGEGWHIALQSQNPNISLLTGAYPLIGKAFSGASLTKLVFITSEVAEELESERLGVMVASEDPVPVLRGVNLCSTLDVGTGVTKNILQTAMAGSFSGTEFSLTGRLNRDAIDALLSGVVENQVGDGSFDTTGEGDDKKDDVLTELSAGDDEDAPVLLELELSLPPVTPFPYSTINNKNALHVEFEQTAFTFAIDINKDFTLTASREANIWFLNNKETVSTTLTIAFADGAFAGIAVEGESSVSWGDKLGIEIPKFSVEKLIFTGSMEPAEEGVAVGFGLGVEVTLFDSTTVQAILGVGVEENKIQEITLDFAAAAVEEESGAEDSAKSGAFSINNIPGIKEIPLVNELSFDGFSLGFSPTSKDAYFKSEVFWEAKNISAKMGIMLVDKRPIILLRTENFKVGTFIPSAPTLVADLGFPVVAIVASSTDLAEKFDDLPEGIQELLLDISSEGGDIPITNGISLITAMDMNSLPTLIQTVFDEVGIDKPFMESLGIDGPLVIAGSVEGIFGGGSPGIALALLLPKIKIPDLINDSPMGKMIRFNDVAGSLFIRANSSGAEIGIAGEMEIDLPRLDSPTEVDTVLTGAEIKGKISLAGDIGVVVLGTVKGLWNNPLGIQKFSIGNGAILFGISATAAVELGIAGDLKYIGAGQEVKTLQMGMNLGVQMIALPPFVLPKKLGIALKATQLSLGTVNEIQLTLLQGMLQNPVLAQVIEPTLFGPSRDAYDYILEELKDKTLFEIFQLDKLPSNYVNFRDLNIYLATPGAVIPGRDDLNLGIGAIVEGGLELVIPTGLGTGENETFQLAETSNKLTLGDGFKISGKISDFDIGVLALKNAELDVRFGIPFIHEGAPQFVLRGDSTILFITGHADVGFSLSEVHVDLNGNAGPFGEVDLKLDTEYEGAFPSDFTASFEARQNIEGEMRKNFKVVIDDTTEKFTSSIASSQQSVATLERTIKEMYRNIDGVRRAAYRVANGIGSRLGFRKREKWGWSSVTSVAKSVSSAASSAASSVSSTATAAAKAVKARAATAARAAATRARIAAQKLARRVLEQSYWSALRVADVAFESGVKIYRDKINIEGRLLSVAKLALQQAEGAINELNSLSQGVLDRGGLVEFKKIKIHEFSVVRVINGEDELAVEIEVELLGKRINKTFYVPGANPEALFGAMTKLFTKVLRESPIFNPLRLKATPNVPAPANDLFSNALLLTGTSGEFSASNHSATLEEGEDDHAAVGSECSVWYTWSTETDGGVSFSTTNNNFDTTIAVYTGTQVDRLALITNNDDASSTTTGSSKVSFKAKAGIVYHIAVAGALGKNGNFAFIYESTEINAPANDDFASPASLALDDTVDFNLIDSSLEVNEPIHGGIVGEGSVWYTLILNESSKVMLSATGTNMNTLIGVYTGTTLLELEKIIDNDDIDSTGRSEATFSAQAGVTYFVAVGSKGTRGQGSLAVKIDTIARPVNDNRNDATVLTGAFGVHTTNNTNATTEGNEPLFGTASLWYTWVAPQTGMWEFNTNKNGLDTLLEVYQIKDGKLMPITSNDNRDQIVVEGTEATVFELDRSSLVYFPVVQGDSYLIRLATMDTKQGSIDLNYRQSFAPNLSVNDALVDALKLTGDLGSSEGDFSFASLEKDEIQATDVVGSLWWEWLPQSDTQLTFTSTTQIKIYALNKGFSDLKELQSSYTLNKVTSSLTINARAGQRYAIALLKTNGLADNVSLNWSKTNFKPTTNDNRNLAKVVTGEDTVRFSTVLATAEKDEKAHAGFDAQHSVWFKLTSATESWYQFNVLDIEFASSIAVYTENEGVLKEQTSSFGIASLKVNAKVSSGETIWIAIDSGNDEEAGILSIIEIIPELPSNDNFASARAFAPSGETLAGDSSYATLETDEIVGDLVSVRSVWYTWTPTSDSRMQLSLGITDFAPVFVVYEGSSLTDLNALSGSNKNNASVFFEGTSGTTYHFVVAGASTGGAFDLTLVAAPIDRPANNDIAFAQAIQEGSITANNSGATTDSINTRLTASVWYTYTAVTDGDLFIEVNGSEMGTGIAVYTNSTPPTLIRENDGYVENADGSSELAFAVKADVSYFIQVGSIGGEQAEFSLSLIHKESKPAINDNFAQAIELPKVSGSSSVAIDNATLEVSETLHQVDTTGSAWWRWIASDTGKMKLSWDVNFNAGVYVYTGSSLTNLSLISKVDSIDINTTLDITLITELELDVTLGQVLYIAVGIPDGSGLGLNAELSVSFAPTVPVADAGPDMKVSEGQAVFLSAGASFDFDGEIKSYNWELLTEVPFFTVNGVDSIVASFIAPYVASAGNELKFRLTVVDNSGFSATDDISVFIDHRNAKPIAIVYPLGEVRTGVTLSLDASLSYDAEGSSLTYGWTQSYGSALSITDFGLAKASVTVPDTKGGYRFEVNVADDKHSSSSESVIVNVLGTDGVAPFADAGNDQKVSALETVTLSAIRSDDSEGFLRYYEWRQIAGTKVSLSGALTATATFKAPTPLGRGTSLVFEILIQDNENLIATDTVMVHVLKSGTVLPKASPYRKIVGTLGESLSVSSSIVLDTAYLESVKWSPVAQRKLDMSTAWPTFNAQLKNPTFTLPTAGGPWSYKFEALDSDGLRTEGLVELTHSTLADPVFKDLNVTVTQQTSANIPYPRASSLATTDTIRWHLVSKLQSALTGVFSSNLIMNTENLAGRVDLNVQTKTISGLVYNDYIMVNIIPEGKSAPIANAGIDKTVKTGAHILLKSIGTIRSDWTYAWEQLGGDPVRLVDPSSAKTSFILKPAGSKTVFSILVFQLTVTDSLGLSSMDTVRYAVEAKNNVRFSNSLMELNDTDSGLAYYGFELPTDGELLTATWLKKEKDSQIMSANGGPDQLDRGLTEFSLRVNEGQVGKITIYLDTPASADTKWWKFSRRLNKWFVMEAPYAVFSTDRSSVVLNIPDNSIYDDDTRLGYIADPSGLGVQLNTATTATNATTNASENSITTGSTILPVGLQNASGGGGCFLSY